MISSLDALTLKRRKSTRIELTKGQNAALNAYTDATHMQQTTN